ncbi:metalloregulator ArsR/SmtB family transcription factor [bacterium]|nr:metalloregulator ArsR/SmtB family transcription factor [bacterium]
MNLATEHALFKALADPTRLRIVILLTRREMCVCDLTEVLSLPQSTVSRHMGILKSAGVVSDNRQGKWVHYSLESGSPIEELRQFFAAISVREPYQSDLIKLTMRGDMSKC